MHRSKFRLILDTIEDFLYGLWVSLYVPKSEDDKPGTDSND